MTNETSLYNVVVLAHRSILKLLYHNKNLPRLVVCPIRDEIWTAALYQLGFVVGAPYNHVYDANIQQQ